MKEPNLQDLLKAGVHFGHRKSRWNPNMAEYIYTTRDGIHVIDLQKTAAKLREALLFSEETIKKGGNIVFVGTKRQAKDIVKKAAENCGMPYVNERWLGGTFTNFSEIKKQIKKLLDYREQQESGDLEKYTKKERLVIEEEIEKLEKKFGGLVDLKRLPDAVLIVDVPSEQNAFDEAKRRGVTVIALADTNVNPKGIDYPVPSNDDAIKSIECILNSFSETIKEAIVKRKKEADKESAKAAKKSADEADAKKDKKAVK
ncbi:30S ribosomal protein S2 [Patescibacteria group bacterium]|nr:30S ribosomal protein S2 [Patescibacteria group bacterium]